MAIIRKLKKREIKFNIDGQSERDAEYSISQKRFLRISTFVPHDTCHKKPKQIITFSVDILKQLLRIIKEEELINVKEIRKIFNDVED